MFANNYYKHFFVPNLAVNLGVGIRAHHLNAKTTFSEISGGIIQPIINAGLNYSWLAKHQTQVGLKTTTNVEFDDFTNEMSDLLRYNYTVYHQCHINEKITLMIGYEGLIYPNKDLYRVENPRHLISCGIQYNFWK